jgi:hypothetical protein
MPKSHPAYLASFRADAAALVCPDGTSNAVVAADSGVSAESQRSGVFSVHAGVV